MTEFNVEKRNNELYISGEIDVSNCSEFKSIVLEHVNDTNEDMVMNFENLQYIDSAGLGIVVGIYKRLKEKDAKLIISGCGNNIRKLFTITKLDTLIEVR